MKLLFRYLLLILFLSSSWSQGLKPYIHGANSDQPREIIAQQLKEKLNANGFQVIGEYSPAADDNRLLLVITSKLLLDAVSEIGNYSAFAAVLRIAITYEDNINKISYMNPMYWGNAYYQQHFVKMERRFWEITQRLANSMVDIVEPVDIHFGSERGLSPRDLQKYHYMFGMEYFEDRVDLNSFTNFTTAVKTIDANLEAGVPNLDLVYSLKIPGKNLKLYGIGLSGELGESHFLPIIDKTSPQHTAFLPYEFLVIDNNVVMLHGRYRIALSFPDLSMMTFGKIMSTPGDIEKLMRSASE